MNTITEVFFDPTLYGHRLVKPAHWYGRHVSQLFTKPFPENFFSAALDILARAVAFVALVVLSPSLVAITPCALIGWAIKYYFQPVAPPSTVDQRVSQPSTPEASPRNPNPPSLVSSTPEVSPRNPTPLSPSFVPFTPEIIQAAQRKADELRELYNGLRELSSRSARNLFNGLAEFCLLYDQYRNPDPNTSNELTKIFHTVDEIVTNTSGMQIALQHWSDFYQVRADSQGVIPQPKDGNCWLHTSILGLRHINHPNLRDDTYLTLRPKVVEWMESNYATDENLIRHIDSAIESLKTFETISLQENITSLKEALKGNLVPNDQLEQAQAALEEYEMKLVNLKTFTVNDYFEYMKLVGTHGSHAELYAISRLFQVNIAVWRDIPAAEDAPSRLSKDYDEQIECLGAEHTVNAVLTQEGDHFNYRLPLTASISGNSS